MCECGNAGNANTGRSKKSEERGMFAGDADRQYLRVRQLVGHVVDIHVW